MPENQAEPVSRSGATYSCCRCSGGPAGNLCGDCMGRELALLKELEAVVVQRRTTEPRHSHPDHDHCRECEILEELWYLRKPHG